ncbi:LptF/LptG family permease [Limnochorda pilosa]|uniref:YjgP/YjgQ family permease n=1 Tax=Limnochorda pilosa TaxID=1555112 RepID=A0A0K2SP19_LIMPI|nr:LptF/LptG family permease [Limnochorda pilosa]BAS28883.1 hypothetical protein LIP_3054 [Limnochorda pilosa]
MRALDRFVLKELAGPVIFGFGAFTSLFLASEMVNLANLAAELRAPVEALLRVFLLGIPQILVWTLPMGIMVGSLLTLSRLSANSEVVALQAGGYSLRRVTRPVLLLGLSLALLAAGMNEWVAPWANIQRERVMVEQVRGRTLPVDRRNVTLQQFQGGRLAWFLYAARYYPAAQTMNDVTMIRLDQGRPVETTYARQVVWAGNEWQMEDGESYRFGADGQAVRIAFEGGRRPAAIPYRPGQVSELNRPPAQMGLRELGARILALRGQGVEARTERVEWNLKLALPFASFVFALLGAGLGIQSHRSATSVGFGLSVGIIFIYYVVMTLGTALGKSGGLPPELGAWVQNLLGLAVGGFLWIRLDR